MAERLARWLAALALLALALWPHGALAQVDDEDAGDSPTALMPAAEFDRLRARGLPWWEVDLGSAQPIEHIILWNRTDGDVGTRRLSRDGVPQSGQNLTGQRPPGSS